MAEDRHPALDLPPQERTDYLTVVAILAAADGHVHDLEISKLREWCKALELPASGVGKVIAAAEAPESVDLNVVLGRLKNSKLRFTLITDLVFLGNADGAYVMEERAEVTRISNEVGVTGEQVAAIEKYVVAVLRAQSAEGVSGADLKKLGGDVAGGLASAGVPVAAVAVSGSVFGLSAAGITSGLAALGMGLGMATGVGVAAGIGVASYFGVKWLYRKIVEA